ncbi:MAG: hypothetical protein RL346_1930 [Verrucomicrobiota bacterium]|jgi:hypothetical protein
MFGAEGVSGRTATRNGVIIQAMNGHEMGTEDSERSCTACL